MSQELDFLSHIVVGFGSYFWGTLAVVSLVISELLFDRNKRKPCLRSSEEGCRLCNFSPVELVISN